MANVVVIGAQWGDEGKAKITDLLAEEADIIIRYQGGCNAGHTVVANNETFKFHLIPSGILYKGKTCIIGPGTVINPQVLTEEIENLKRRGVDTMGLHISTLAHVTLPYHIDLDSKSEEASGDKKIGTTNKGIGPTYADKINRIGIRIEDLYDEEALNDKLDFILPQKNALLEKLYNAKGYTKEEIIEFCKKYADFLKPYIQDTNQIIKNALKSCKKILFEGAQGTMLDIDHGTYPYVTSSNPISGGACTGAGVGPTCIHKVIGISKAYVTRVGEGPFITELDNSIGERIRETGHEFGTTTGRPRRCGWFDAVVARYSVQINGLTDMAITKLDVFDEFDEIQICTSYRDRRNGIIYEDYPTNIYLHKHLEPVYETVSGWNSKISDARILEELPKNARKFLRRIEELIEIPVSIISIGAVREETIILENPVTSLKRDYLTKI